MKKIYYLLFIFFNIYAFSQQETNTQWKAQINPIFAGLDKSRIPNAILNDYAMEFTNLSAYNGTLTDSTYIDANGLGNIYKTLFMGKVTTATQYFPTMQTIASNWVTHRRSYNQTEQSTMVVAGLFYQYSRIKSNSLVTNKITVTNNKYYDKFISSVWQNPYETLSTIAFTPAINTYNKKSFGIVLPSNLLLTNSATLINKIELNCNDGNGYKIISTNQKVYANYAENGIYSWVFKITLTNGTTLFSHSQVKIEAPETTSTTVLKTEPAYENNVLIPGSGSGSSAYYNGAKLRIDYAPSHNGQIIKPFIIAEGFDSGSITNPEKEGGDRTLYGRGSFFQSLQNSGNLSDLLLYDSTQQYDIIYIDWQNGTNDIKENSKVLKSVLDWVNSKKLAAGSTQQNVLLGQSMGGLIGRYTLAKMEHDGIPHDVRLFIAHDSPMQGANVPVSTQFFSRHIYDNYTEAPILYGAVEYLIPTLLNFTELLSLGSLQLSFPSLSDILTIQDTPAALQLNYHYVDALSNPTMAVHQNWQQEFDAMGYPQLCRKIAISNGNECAVNHGFNAGDKFISLHSKLSPAVFGDISGMIIDFALGMLTTDFNLAILGILPGSSKYNFDFDLHSNPETTTSNRKVYYGRIRYEKKLLFLVTITHTITERTKTIGNAYLPFDTYSGGYYDIRNVTKSIPINLSNSIFINPKYGFIPVVSALDIKRNNQAVVPSDYLRKYGGGTITEPALSTGFDNFIVDYSMGNFINNAHISFQTRNGNWLAHEMQINPANPIYPIENCSFICSNSQITGTSKICSTSNYSAPMGAPIYSWTIIEGGDLATISGTTTPNITLSPLSNTAGFVTIKVVYGDNDVKCGNVTLTKRVHIGAPTLNSFTFGNSGAYNSLCIAPDRNYSYSIPELDFTDEIFANFDGLTTEESSVASNWEWQKLNNIILYNGTKNKRSICTMAAGSTSVSVRVRNSCGWSDWVELPFEITQLPPTYERQTQTNFYTISPNPARDIVNIDLRDQNNNPTQGATVIGELFDLSGQSKSTVSIINNKVSFSVAGLNRGIYVLKIYINDHQIESHQIAVE